MNILLYNMEKNMSPLCLNLAIVLGIISFLNGIGITFLIVVLLKFRYTTEDEVEDAKKIVADSQNTELATVGVKSTDKV
jgi:hypothetical protein